MRTIAVVNQKGGTGKTTTTVCLGAALAGMGRRVLLIDLDPDRPALYLHVLDAGTPELIEKAIAGVLAQERRVVEAWAPRAERDAWREEVGA